MHSEIRLPRRSGRALSLPLTRVPAWLARQPQGLIIGVLLLVAILLFTYPGAIVYTGSPYAVDPIHQTEAPSALHLLGTDQLGRDELARLITGGQASLYIGFAASFVAIVVGLLYGLAAGLGLKIADTVLMRLLDALLAVPTVVILIFLSSLYRLNDFILILLLGFTSWPRTARVVRNETFAARSRDFVIASRQFGGGAFWIARKHILRVILPVLMVNFVFLIADNIIALSFLSFLGLGVQPPTPSWGNLLYDGLQNIFTNAWWLIYPAGAMVFLTVVAVNLIGESVVASMERS